MVPLSINLVFLMNNDYFVRKCTQDNEYNDPFHNNSVGLSNGHQL